MANSPAPRDEDRGLPAESGRSAAVERGAGRSSIAGSRLRANPPGTGPGATTSISTRAPPGSPPQTHIRIRCAMAIAASIDRGSIRQSPNSVECERLFMCWSTRTGRRRCPLVRWCVRTAGQAPDPCRPPWNAKRCGPPARPAEMTGGPAATATRGRARNWSRGLSPGASVPGVLRRGPVVAAVSLRGGCGVARCDPRCSRAHPFPSACWASTVGGGRPMVPVDDRESLSRRARTPGDPRP